MKHSKYKIIPRKKTDHSKQTFGHSRLDSVIENSNLRRYQQLVMMVQVRDFMNRIDNRPNGGKETTTISF